MAILNAQAVGSSSTNLQYVSAVYSDITQSTDSTYVSFTVTGRPKSWSMVGVLNASTTYWAKAASSSNYVIGAYYDSGTDTIIGEYVNGRGRIYRLTSGITTSYSNGTFTVSSSTLLFPMATSSGSSTGYLWRFFYTV